MTLLWDNEPKSKAIVTKYSNHPSDDHDSLTHHNWQNPQKWQEKGNVYAEKSVSRNGKG